jgi:hypothetical protein
MCVHSSYPVAAEVTAAGQGSKGRAAHFLVCRLTAAATLAVVPAPPVGAVAGPAQFCVLLLLPVGCAAQGLDEVVIASIMRSVVQGLDYVHQNGGIHRDIKVGTTRSSALISTPAPQCSNWAALFFCVLQRIP